MRKQVIHEAVAPVSRIGIGCLRVDALEKEPERVERFIDGALDCGINLFDHADIYGAGLSEEVFGRALTPARREKMVLQTKCVIIPGVCYDSSKEHIISSAEMSLRRLRTDHIDLFLLHRPDALMEPEEIAEAVNTLKRDGKILTFGVSNHNPSQMEMLAAAGCAPAVNQFQFSLAHCPSIDEGMNFNIQSDAACMRTGNVLDYCRMKGITPQAWCPFQYGMFEGIFIGSEKYPELNAQLDRLAAKYEASPFAIAAAWILRHPAHVIPMAGSTNPGHIADIAKADEIELTRSEWYSLYLSAGKILP